MTKYILLRANPRDGTLRDKHDAVVAFIHMAKTVYHDDGTQTFERVNLTPAIVELPSEKANVNDFGYAEGRAAHENSRIDGFNACITDMEDRRDGRA